VDIKCNANCGFWATTDFLGLTEESHIIVRRHLVQEVKDHINDYVCVFVRDDRFNYILNDLHPPKNSSGVVLVDKWVTFPDMGHIVATYYNRLVVKLTNHEMRTSIFFPN